MSYITQTQQKQTVTYQEDPAFTTPNNYQVRIYSNKSSDIIRANIPEEFSLAVQSTWNTPFNKGLTERMSNLSSSNSQVGQTVGFSGRAGAAASAATGITGMNKFQTISVWEQSQPISLQLPLVFRAFDDPVKDVTDRVLSLMQMALPSTSPVGTMMAPGPTILSMTASGAFGGLGSMVSGGAAVASTLGSVTGISPVMGLLGSATGLSDPGENITVEIGNFLKFPFVIIKTVSAAMQTEFDENGNIMSATVNVDIETPYVVTKEDLAKYFLRNNSSWKNSLASGFSQFLQSFNLFGL